MKKFIIQTHRVVHIAIVPVTFVVEKLHVRRIIKSKRGAKVVIGIGFCLTGSTMALYPITAVPHVIWDAVAYILHGYGSLPMIKLACEKLNLESIDENSDDEIDKLEKRLNKLKQSKHDSFDI